MYISVVYKDVPELSSLRRRSSEPDSSTEKVLLVNPNCPVRIMLEYIRKRCRLGTFTQFDLCDESGYLKGLFSMPTYVYATDQFQHKNTYYVIVIKQVQANPAYTTWVALTLAGNKYLVKELDRRLSVLPQLNHDNQIYIDLKNRVKKYLAGEASPVVSSPASTIPTKVALTAPKAASKKK